MIIGLRNFFLHIRLFFTSNKAKEHEIKRLRVELAEKMQELEVSIENVETKEEKERLIALKQKITAVGEEYKGGIEKLTQ